MTNLKGTEKQVKFANDIKKAIDETVEYLVTTLEEEKENMKEKLVAKASERLNIIKSEIETKEDATEIINEYKEFMGLNFHERLLNLSKKHEVPAKVAIEAQRKYNRINYPV